MTIYVLRKEIFLDKPYLWAPYMHDKQVVSDNRAKLEKEMERLMREELKTKCSQYNIQNEPNVEVSKYYELIFGKEMRYSIYEAVNLDETKL